VTQNETPNEKLQSKDEALVLATYTAGALSQHLGNVPSTDPDKMRKAFSMYVRLGELIKMASA